MSIQQFLSPESPSHLSPSEASPPPESSSPTEIAKLLASLLDLRIEEMAIREQIYGGLELFHQRLGWRKMGYKSFKDFCQKQMDYNAADIRQIFFALKIVLPSTSLVSDDRLIQDRILELRHWRSLKAVEKNIPAYRVFTNRTLLALAELWPKNSEELILIPGIGPFKMAEFGAELLCWMDQRRRTN